MKDILNQTHGLILSGTDVMRKIMILASEAGEKLEMEDITNNSFMPEILYGREMLKIFIKKWQNRKHIFKNL